MVYNTLIILDTNKIKHDDYEKIELGGDYGMIKKFVEENNLNDWIKIAIPEYVIEEVKQQKREKYNNDKKEFKRISKKFNSLEIISQQQINEFDIEKYFDEKLSDYISRENIKILKLDDEQCKETLKEIIKRALAKKLPFKKNDKHSDMGFKDVLIWETILKNKGAVSWYHNIYYCSGDNGFTGCKEEFEKEHNRNFDLFTSADLLIEKLSNEYSNQIENKQIFSLINDPYFSDQVKDYVMSLETWEDLDGDECEIIDVEILDRCTDFEKNEGNKENGEGDSFEVESYVELELEKEDNEGKIVSSQIDAYVKTTIDENNDFIDFEIN